MARRPRKSDHVKYVGPYAPGLPEAAKYSPGVVVGFRDQGEKATVQLDDSGLFADWPVEECELMEEKRDQDQQ